MSVEFQVLKFLAPFIFLQFNNNVESTDTQDFLPVVADFHCMVLVGPEHAMLARLASNSGVHMTLPPGYQD